ncbi:hypothetical protein ACWEWG_01860 [Streptomyces sp. NPDC003758]
MPVDDGVERIVLCAGPYALERWRIGIVAPLVHAFATGLVLGNAGPPVTVATRADASDWLGPRACCCRPGSADCGSRDRPTYCSATSPTSTSTCAPHCSPPATDPPRSPHSAKA